jgi:hypothetical protein
MNGKIQVSSFKCERLAKRAALSEVKSVPTRVSAWVNHATSG